MFAILKVQELLNQFVAFSRFVFVLALFIVFAGVTLVWVVRFCRRNRSAEGPIKSTAGQAQNRPIVVPE